MEVPIAALRGDNDPLHDMLDQVTTRRWPPTGCHRAFIVEHADVYRWLERRVD